ncbi:hypothetical protein SAMN04490243_2465 [Robiginitalea myxolifaciens]|uniref:Uncharacterized protein n=1 Tax=Robiginitalea myxolifaciens TaxID=400055 RepID=A0A1I6HA84_9FLAO|nr:hypothetical protein [Robiginitalea myxolifaciens]SFR51288.1 hypothetical protein SAMN04490243_2465 [Robiginitalea myxolifaciens]
MNYQYCKVGASTPPAKGVEGVRVLENRYREFKMKAEKAVASQNPLKDFFEGKARSMQRLIQECA